MRLPKSDPLYADLPTSMQKSLPDWSDIEFLQGSGLAIADLQAQLALSNAEIYSQATQIAFGGITTGIGTSMILFDAMTESMGINVERVTTDVLEQIAGSVASALNQMDEGNDILDTTLEAGVGFAVNLASAIPIVGWIIKIAWNVAKTIVNIVRIANENSDPKFLYPPSRFSPDADLSVLNNSVLSRMRSLDWSNLFYPPGAGSADLSGRRFYFNDLEGGGVRIITADQDGFQDGWVGFIPGTVWLHQAIEIFPGQKISETGNMLLPSSAQQCSWIWRNVSRTATPSAFTVWAERAGGMWGEYIDDLKVAVNESDMKVATKKAVFKKFDRQGDYPVFGWGDGSSVSAADYSPYKLMKELRQRQLDLCDTLLVAEISADFGALQDPVVRERWDQRRKDLLEHPAVCRVKLEDIPDAIYRGAVEFRQDQIQCSGPELGGPMLAAPSLPTPVDGFAIPGGDRPPRARPRPHEDPDRGAKIALGVILALGGTAAVYRHRDVIVEWMRKTGNKLNLKALR